MDPLTTSIGAAAVALGAAGGYLSPVLWKRVAIRRLQAKCVEQRVLALTYDDGPGPSVTQALVELLAEFDAPATFFLSGERVLPNADIAHSLVRQGHEVGCHGYHHLHAWKNLPGALEEDFARGCGAVVSCGAVDPIAFRPPFGKLVLPTWLAAKHRGARLAWWTHDSGDSFAELPSRSPALDLLDTGGGVALLHDLDRSGPRNEFVLATTRALLEGARDKGLRVVRFSDLFA